MRVKGTETILAVDDDPIMLELLEDVLVPLGYRVISAATGEEAIQLTSESDEMIDLRLVDVFLPGIMGQELAVKLKNARPHMNILFMSGYMCPSMAREEKSEGVEAFIQKPFAPNSLLRKLRQLLDSNETP